VDSWDGDGNRRLQLLRLMRSLGVERLERICVFAVRWRSRQTGMSGPLSIGIRRRRLSLRRRVRIGRKGREAGDSLPLARIGGYT
jgi:hypothetical protein